MRKINRREILKLGGLALTSFALPFPLTAFAKFDTMEKENKFDVIIIGGSYAGLSAAMSLGRSLKKVLIIDSGKPCNRYTPHSHNFITHDGAVPKEIALKAKEQVLKYDTVQFCEDTALEARKMNAGFEITTKTGKIVTGKKLLFATGVKDLFPDVKNFEECWGKSVIHCPYCHGYEFKGKKTAILSNGERAFHVAALVRNLTEEITILTNGIPDFKEEQLVRLKKNKIQIIDKELVKVVHENGSVNALIFSNGSKEFFDTVYASIPFEQHSDIPYSLGCEFTETKHIKVDMFQKTTVPGVFACGDNSSPMRSVSYAVATGGIAGSMINNELTMEGF